MGEPADLVLSEKYSAYILWLILAGRYDKIHPITHLFSATACAACAVAGCEGERGGK
jgi:hypothetical protein